MVQWWFCSSIITVETAGGHSLRTYHSNCLTLCLYSSTGAQEDLFNRDREDYGTWDHLGLKKSSSSCSSGVSYRHE